MIVCEASIGTGNTHNAIRIVGTAVEQNTNALILVPIHALAQEWEQRLDLDDSISMVDYMELAVQKSIAPISPKQIN